LAAGLGIVAARIETDEGGPSDFTPLPAEDDLDAIEDEVDLRGRESSDTVA
jgi:hypothetical protein